MAPLEPSLHVVLVEPEIHWNTGNIGRTCLAVNAQLHLVEPLGFSLDERQVKRAGLDYWERVKPRLWPAFEAFEAALPQLGDAFFFSPEAERTLWDVDYGDRPVLVFGRETRGFDATIRHRYRDRMVAIPVVEDSVRSLNLSNCVSIAVFEVMRRRTLTGRTR